jgi:hypothetical protein
LTPNRLMAFLNNRPVRKQRSNDAISSDEVTRLNKEKQSRQKESDAATGTQATDEPDPKDKPEPATSPNDTATITNSQFEQLMDAVKAGAEATKKVEVLEQELADTKAALEAKETAVQATEGQKEELDFVQKLFADLGHPNPAEGKDRINSQVLVTGAKMDAKAALREFEDALKDCPTDTWADRATGQIYEQTDTRKVDRFIKQNRQAVQDAMEVLAKQNGLLRGKDAATVRTDIPPAFLTYLSSIMRMQHSAKFVYWQFATAKLEMGKGKGDTIQVPRTPYANTGTLLTDWQLTPGTPIVTTRQRVAIDAVTVTLQEYGMGKNGTIEPIAVPEFILANSQIQLEQAVMKNLGHNYQEYEDIALRTQWFNSTKTIYNDRSNPVPLPASVVATTATDKNRSGALTYAFLIQLFAYMSGLQIPTYENGCYALVLHPKALAQLKASLAQQNQYLTMTGVEDVTNIFNALNQQEAEKVSSYEGTIANFMIFSTNNNSVGAPGAVGVQTETVAAVAQTTRTSFAVGANSIGRGTGTPAQIRRQVEDDFGRMNSWIWIAHEGFGQLDVDNVFAGQQTRVLQIRTTDLEV